MFLFVIELKLNHLVCPLLMIQQTQFELLPTMFKKTKFTLVSDPIVSNVKWWPYKQTMTRVLKKVMNNFRRK